MTGISLPAGVFILAQGVSLIPLCPPLRSSRAGRGAPPWRLLLCLGGIAVLISWVVVEALGPDRTKLIENEFPQKLDMLVSFRSNWWLAVPS